MNKDPDQPVTLAALVEHCAAGGSVTDFSPSAVADAVVTLLPAAGNAGATYYRSAAHTAVEYVCTAMQRAPQYRFSLNDVFAPETRAHFKNELAAVAAESAQFANAVDSLDLTLRVLAARNKVQPHSRAA